MKYPPHPLTPDEARALLSACGRGWRGARNRALVAVLWRAGLRAREACGLELAHVRRLELGAEILVAQAKGGRPRMVGLDQAALELVDAWLNRRGREPGHLFVSATGAPLQTSYLRQLLPWLARRAGIRRRVHPHALRHTFARELYDEGVRLREIQLCLGHRSLATTENYLRSIGATEAVSATARREWR